MSVVGMVWTIAGLLVGTAILRGFLLPPARSPLFVWKRSRKVLVATGASATHGRLSYDWVSKLDRRLRGDDWTCLNVAWNGRRAVDVRRRLGSVIEKKPDVVVVMVGVNDVNRSTSLERYRAELEAIVDRLQRETRATIGLCTLTAIGDDLQCSAMQRAAGFNRAVREVAASRGVGCIDVAAAQIAWLAQEGRPTKWPLIAFPLLMLSSTILHYALFFPYNLVSRVHGLRLTTDLVHQNQTGGAMITDLVERFVRESFVEGS